MIDLIDEILFPGRVGKIYTIGLTLPQDQRDAAIALSKEISKKYNVEYVLDVQGRPPFVRLYETVFPQENVQKVIDAVKSIAQESPPLNMKWGALETAVHNIIMWGELSEQLDIFHKKVLSAINPLRDGYFKQKYSNDSQFVFKEDEDSLMKWGSRWAQNYIPHMIVAKSKNKFVVGKLLELEWEYRRCKLPEMLVGEKIPHGGLKEFQIFPLQGKH